jgi:hypothetical protein
MARPDQTISFQVILHLMIGALTKFLLLQADKLESEISFINKNRVVHLILVHIGKYKAYST